jgi:hypothetical protein
MGTSVKRLEERRALPWPRYRLSTWQEDIMVWKEVPTLYYERGAALAVAEALEHKGHKVRVCILHRDGSKQDLKLDDFRRLADGKKEASPGA